MTFSILWYTLYCEYCCISLHLIRKSSNICLPLSSVQICKIFIFPLFVGLRSFMQGSDFVVQNRNYAWIGLDAEKKII